MAEQFWEDHPEIEARGAELVKHGKSAAQAANILSLEFNVPVTRNALIGRMHRTGVAFTRSKTTNLGNNGFKRVNKKTFKAKLTAALLAFQCYGVPTEPQPLPEPPDVQDFLGIEFFDLKEGMCRFPRGDERYVYCGMPVRHYGESWCENCHKIVYRQEHRMNLSEAERERRRQFAKAIFRGRAA